MKIIARISLYLPLITLVVAMGCCYCYSQEAGKGKITGSIKEKGSGAPLIGANIYLKTDLTVGTTANLDGNYSIELNPGKYTLMYSYTGMLSVTREVEVKEGETLRINLEMEPFSSSFKEIVISSGRYDRAPEQLMVTTEIMRKDLLESKNVVSVETALDQIPGVNILDEEPQIRGGSGFTFGVGSKVAVILDQMPMINAAAGKPNWDLIPVENINQIEVVKGPGSVLTGANAMSGAIYFKTEYAGEIPKTKVRLYGGMYAPPQDTSRKWWDGNNYISGLSFLHARHLDSAKSIDLVFSGMGHFEQGYLGAPKEGIYNIGDNDIADSNIHSNKVRFNLNLRKQSRKIQGLTYGINGSYMKDVSPTILAWFDDTSGFYRGYPGAILLQEKTIFYIDPFVNILSQAGLKHQLMFRIMDEDIKQFNGKKPRAHTTSLFGQYLYSKRFANIKGLYAIGGLSGQQTNSNDSMYTAGGSTKNEATNVSLFLEVEKKFGKELTFLVGFRGEYYAINDEDQYIVPLIRASLNFKVFQETFLRVSYGQGVRFPTIAERKIRYGFGAFGVFDNPDLEPETAWNAELGIKQGFKFNTFYGYLDVAGFIQRYDNTVEYLFGFWDSTGQVAPAGFKFVNTGKSQVSGFDVSLNGSAKWGNKKGNNINIMAGYTYVVPVTLEPDLIYSEDYYPGGRREYSYKSTSVNPDSKILKYRFRHTVKIDMEYLYRGFFVGGSCRYFSKMENVDTSIFEFEDATKTMGAGTPPMLFERYYDEQNNGNIVFDGRIGYEFKKRYKLALISTNLLNRTYSLRPLKAEAMRSVILQLVATL